MESRERDVKEGSLEAAGRPLLTALIVAHQTFGDLLRAGRPAELTQHIPPIRLQLIRRYALGGPEIRLTDKGPLGPNAQCCRTRSRRLESLTSRSGATPRGSGL